MRKHESLELSPIFTLLFNLFLMHGSMKLIKLRKNYLFMMGLNRAELSVSFERRCVQNCLNIFRPLNFFCDFEKIKDGRSLPVTWQP